MMSVCPPRPHGGITHQERAPALRRRASTHRILTKLLPDGNLIEAAASRRHNSSEHHKCGDTSSTAALGVT
jgi:hypothetical protein